MPQRAESRFYADFHPDLEIEHHPFSVDPLVYESWRQQWAPRDVLSGPAANQALALAGAPALREELRTRGITSPLYVWHGAIGSGVHGTSRNIFSNKGYHFVRNYRLVPPGSALRAKTRVIAVGARKGRAYGPVLVETEMRTPEGELICAYRRTPLVLTQDGKALEQDVELAEPVPRPFSLDEIDLLPFRSVPASLLGEHGLVFDELEDGQQFVSTESRGIPVRQSLFVTTVTMNDSQVHQDPASGFLEYGPTVIDICLEQVREFLPVSQVLEMPNINHTGPLFPEDVRFRELAMDDPYYDAEHPVVLEVRPAGAYPGSEQVSSRATLLGRHSVPGREDGGVVELRLEGFKKVSPEGVSMLRNASGGKFARVLDKIGSDGLLRILDAEVHLWLPRRRAR
jgi:hypothetical protein